MRIRFLLGPAGSGKTFRCLTEVRQALAASPDGPPLVLVAPKQSTYQLERQFLAFPSIPGYTRLHILSFERLAGFVFRQLHRPAPEMLDEEGRLMVLRGLLARKRDQLQLFRASARLTGFAQQLSQVLRELQRHQLTPETLVQLAGQTGEVAGLSLKLQDLATLLRDYQDWLQAHKLQDAHCLLNSAMLALRSQGPEAQSMQIESLWVDGFAEWSGQELDLLAALLPYCGQATLTFCLDQAPARKLSWLSSWSVVRESFEECKRRLGSLPEANVVIQTVSRHPSKSRFLSNPVLQHLEQCWSEPRPYNPAERMLDLFAAPLERTLRLAVCADPEAEATLAAREILRYVRAGGRYRDVTVLVRKLEGYHEPLQRMFTRYEIPFFLDRRESVSHHPLAELTRNALRTVAFSWQQDDWFGALKTGLAPAADEEIDRLENEALARGWQGAIWQKPIVLPDDQELTAWLAGLHERLLPPFQRLGLALATHQNRPTGPQLAAALRGFWQALNVEEKLRSWAAAETSDADSRMPSSVHATVWEQMTAWLGNIELGFREEPLALRDWLPILEAGLANLTVGVIPPALDQVLIGAMDRSRNPDIKLALVLGMNEGVFPAPPQMPALLTEIDRVELERRNVVLGSTARRQLAWERYYAYIVCTRARERIVFTCAQQDTSGAPLSPSPFFFQIHQLFPGLACERVPKALDWRKGEHVNELLGMLLRAQSPAPRIQTPRAELPNSGSEILNAAGRTDNPPSAERSAGLPGTNQLLGHLRAVPAVTGMLDQVRHFQRMAAEDGLPAELAGRLYGPVLRTSVSRMEQFAACPFKFFVHSGLRAEERQLFELDVKEQGTFQHDVLALFHQELQQENKLWRDITPAEARRRVGVLAEGLAANYRDGLLQATEESRFLARVLTESLQDFVETLVSWMQRQYQLDPFRVELPFGEGEGSPAWTLDLGDGHRLELYGRIDRVDLFRDDASGEALCVVVDYKSSQKQLDTLLMAHGLQLQLLTYLNVLRHWPKPETLFGASRLVPAGVFYVNLHGKYENESNRLDALEDAEQARKLAYRHVGRFDASALRYLDAREDARQGDQFNYRLTTAGNVYKSSREAMSTTDFLALLESVTANLKKMGQAIYAGETSVSPYRKSAVTACDQCSYRSICRIDPWTHRFRVLRKPAEEPAE